MFKWLEIFISYCKEIRQTNLLKDLFTQEDMDKIHRESDSMKNSEDKDS